MDIEKQSNIKNQFDRLICFEVIEHLANDKNNINDYGLKVAGSPKLNNALLQEGSETGVNP